MKAASVGVLDQNVAASGSGVSGEAAAVQANEILRKTVAFSPKRSATGDRSNDAVHR
jgi:hypothetical protein